MGFKFKKVLKKLEKTAKKVAPAALTVVNPSLGASFAAAQVALKAAKQRAQTQGDTSQDLVTVNSSGFTGYTSPTGIADFQSPQPLTGDAERFGRWSAGGYGKSLGALTRSPLFMVAIAGAALLGLLLILRRRR